MEFAETVTLLSSTDEIIATTTKSIKTNITTNDRIMPSIEAKTILKKSFINLFYYSASIQLDINIFETLQLSISLCEIYFCYWEATSEIGISAF